VIAERVRGRSAAEVQPEVHPQLEVVIDDRRAPDLCRVGDGRVACGDQRSGIVALH
jgi:hypothetical protein